MYNVRTYNTRFFYHRNHLEVLHQPPGVGVAEVAARAGAQRLPEPVPVPRGDVPGAGLRTGHGIAAQGAGQSPAAGGGGGGAGQELLGLLHVGPAGIVGPLEKTGEREKEQNQHFSSN